MKSILMKDFKDLIVCIFKIYVILFDDIVFFIVVIFCDLV